MNLLVLRRALVFAMSIVAYGTLQYSGEMPLLTSLLFGVALVGGWFWDRPRVTFERWAKPWTIATLAFFVWTIVDIAFFSDFFLTSALRFVVFLAGAKLFQLSENKDFIQQMALTLLLLAAGSALNEDLSFGVLFAIYVVLATVSLTVQHLVVEISERVGGRPGATRMDRAVLVATVGLAFSVFLGSVGFFFAMPRIGFGYFMQQNRNGVMSSGFGEDVELGSHGTIRDNNEIVMRVLWEDGPPAEPRSIYFRGLSLDRYTGRRWLDRDDREERSGRLVERYADGEGYGVNRGARARWEQAIEGTTRTEINLEPMDSDVLFGPGVLYAISLPNRLTELPDSVTDRRLTADRTGQVKLSERSNLGVRYFAYTVDNPYPESPAELNAIAWPEGSSGVHDFLRTRWQTLGLDAQGPYNPDDPATYTRLNAQARSDAELRDAIHLAEHYLQLPEGQITPRMEAFLADTRARAPDDWRFVLTLRDRLKTEFGYTTDLPRPSGDDANLVDEFLFEWQRGHCEYFATALVVLLRASGIPARIVNGFLGASYNAVGDYYFVTQANAHSWVEVYVPEEGWLRVDPTPGGTPDMGRSGWLGNVQDSIDALRLRWFRWVVEYDLEKQYTLARDAFQAVSGGGEGNSPGDVNQRMRDFAMALFHYWRVTTALVFWLLVASAWFRMRTIRREPWAWLDVAIGTGWLVASSVTVWRTWPGDVSAAAALVAVLPPLLGTALAWYLRRDLLADPGEDRQGRSRGSEAISMWYAALLRAVDKEIGGLPLSITPAELRAVLGLEDAELRAELDAFLQVYEAARYAGVPLSPADAQRWRRAHRGLTRRVVRALRTEAKAESV